MFVPGMFVSDEVPGRLKPKLPPTFVLSRLGSLSGTVTVADPR